MASITIKGIPNELRQRLRREAEANGRSLNQETLARIDRTFDMDVARHSKRDQKWIDEALASGPATPLGRREMDAIRARVLKPKPA